MLDSQHSDELVTVTLSSADCHTLCEIGPLFLTAPSNSELIDKLEEAEALAIWLREDVRVDLTRSDAELLRELRHQAAGCRAQVA